MSVTKSLYQWKYRRCRRGTPTCRHAAMQIADYSGFPCFFVPARHQETWEATTYGETTA